MSPEQWLKEQYSKLTLGVFQCETVPQESLKELLLEREALKERVKELEKELSKAVL